MTRIIGWLRKAVNAFVDFWSGLITTLRSMFTRPVTIQYPEVKRPVRTRFKGRHVLRRYENGLERCIGCALCAAACPADAIFVEAAENTDEKRYSPGERYASTYEINMLRCIFCGYCEDACPTEAIVLGDNYELSFTDRRDSIYTREMLLEPASSGGKPTPQKVEPGVFTRSIPVMENPKD
jgi:NADH-quinone oxidoreductase subunit I